MNCKPKDLAVIVRTQAAGAMVPDELLGAMVRVLEVHETRCGLMWIIAQPITFTSTRHFVSVNGEVGTPGGLYVARLIPDAVLQPIRGTTPPVGKTTDTSAPARAAH